MGMIVKEDVVIALERLGINEGDITFLHSSLSSVGAVQGGANTIIEAFLDILGTEGTLVMPAFSDNVSSPFDVMTTPSDVGVITEAFRRKEGVVRSLHPTHSVCAYGKHAEEIIKDHNLSPTPCGQGTPFFRIRDLKGKIVLLGVDMNRNTMLHAIEEAAEVPYLLEEFKLPAPTYIEGYKDKTLVLKKMPLGHRDFLKLTPILRDLNILEEAFIGNAAVKVMAADKLFNAAMDVLKKRPDFFLCSNFYCNSCMAARMKIEGTYFTTEIYRENHCRWDNCEVCVIE